jgi:sugar phosphate isomerase/epimerase
MQSAPFVTTRRELLLGLAGAALASAKVRNGMYNPEIAAHTSIWLVEAERRKRPLADILDEALSTTHAAGYRRVELTSDFVAAGLKDRTFRLLERSRLEPSIVFDEGPLYTREYAEMSRTRVKDLAWLMMGHGARYLNFSPGVKANGQPMSSAELDTEAYHLNRMGDDIAAAGLDLMVHHREAEMRDNAREWRYLLAHTEPKLVSFCLDVDWVFRAGLSPVSLIDTAGFRLRAVHLRNPRNFQDQELFRDGDIDMAQVARLLRNMQYDGLLVIELLHDRDTKRQYSLATDLSLSRWYAQEMFGSRPGSRPVDMGPHVRLHPHT